MPSSMRFFRFAMQFYQQFFLPLLFAFLLSVLVTVNSESLDETSNTWAVIVSTSKYWHNYRHAANALSIYTLMKHAGVPDQQIILMLADNHACNDRNCEIGTIYNEPQHLRNLYEPPHSIIEVDYKGREVSVENLLRVLTDRHPPNTPRRKRLLSDNKSQVVIYMTGHGADGFIKFQDSEVMSSHDLADAIHQMHVAERYRELFFIADTCQAATLFKHLYSPNVLALGSSQLGQNSYSYLDDPIIGVSLVDRFTRSTLDFVLRSFQYGLNVSIQDLFDSYNPEFLMSNIEYRKDLYARDIQHVPLKSFFGSVNRILVLRSSYALPKVALDNLHSNNSNSIGTVETFHYEAFEPQHAQSDISNNGGVLEWSFQRVRSMRSTLQNIVTTIVLAALVFTVLADVRGKHMILL